MKESFIGQRNQMDNMKLMKEWISVFKGTPLMDCVIFCKITVIRRT
jgi:hypothetical protein